MKLLKLALKPTLLILVFFILLNAFRINRIPVVNIIIKYDTTSFAKSKDTILYKPNVKLLWTDFKGVPPKNTGLTVANSAVGFNYRAKSSSMEDDFELTILINSFFIKKESWCKVIKNEAYILEHEQKHFDLARVGAEIFRQKIVAQRLNKSNWKTFVNKAFSESWVEYQNLQRRYDAETNNSMNKNEQKNWTRKIDSLVTWSHQFK